VFIDILIQKAAAHLRVLNLSTGLDDASKEKIKPVLQASFEESLVEDSSEEDNWGCHSSDSETETSSKSKKKKLVRHTLRWRSEEFEEIIKSLDR